MMNQVVANLKQARMEAANEVHRLDKAIEALSGSRLSANGKMNFTAMGTRPPLSVDARARIAAAQRKRWAAVRAGRKTGKKA